MTRPLDRATLRNRDRAAFAAAVICALIGILIWMLWVLPIVRSVASADPVPLGRTTAVDLEAGDRVGIWADGMSPMLGTMDCIVTAPDGSDRPQRGASPLSWDDLLWWMTPRDGFEQTAQFRAAESGSHLVRCEDSLDTYDGRFLVAGDSIGDGDVGLGRTGGNDFAMGTLLAFGAVVCPPVAVLVPLVILVRRLLTRRSPGSSSR